MRNKSHSLPAAAAAAQRLLRHAPHPISPSTSAAFTIVQLSHALLPLLPPVEAASYPPSYCEGVAGYAKRLYARPASPSFVCLQRASALDCHVGIADLVAAGDITNLRAIGYVITCRMPRRTASLLLRDEPKENKKVPEYFCESGTADVENVVVDNRRVTVLLTHTEGRPLLPHHADTLYIHDLAVHPDFRGLGVAAALWGKIEQTCVQLQLKRMSLVAVFGASRYWLRYGFREVERKALPEATVRVLDDYGDHAVFMERED